MVAGAAKAAAHALSRHEFLKNLDKHDPGHPEIPQTEVVTAYKHAEHLGALKFKYRLASPHRPGVASSGR